MDEEKVNDFTNVTANVLESVANETKSMLHLDTLKEYISTENIVKFTTSVIAILIFCLIYKFVRKYIKNYTRNKFKNQTSEIIDKTIKYGFYIFMAMYILSLFGIKLSAVWGAAGVAGLAIGFAAQTSVSNVISGVFVMVEKSLQVDDFITVDDVSGTVSHVNLLCVTVKTLDGQMVRIPNSTVLGSNLTNFSHYPIRRFVFDLPISYDSDMKTALDAALKIPALCPTVLQDPAPVAFFDGFGDAVNLKLAVWMNRTDFIQTKNDVFINAVKVFNDCGVSIPFTRYDVKLVQDNPNSTSNKFSEEERQQFVQAVNVMEEQKNQTVIGEKDELSLNHITKSFTSIFTGHKPGDENEGK